MFNGLLSWLKKLWEKNGPVCRIEEIDVIKHSVVIHCRGIEAPIILQFDEIIQDIVILSNLSPQHASWIGYCYGKNYSALRNHQNPNSFDFSFTDSNKRYKIILQDRQGRLVYSDHLTQITHTASAEAILTNSSLISQFDSVQACYIGIIAGMNTQKKAEKTAKPFLKLV